MGTLDLSITHKKPMWQRGLPVMPNSIGSSQNVRISVNQIYPHICVGGRISHFKEFWQQNVRDTFCLSVVLTGYKIQWAEKTPVMSYEVIVTGKIDPSTGFANRCIGHVKEGGYRESDKSKT